MMFSCKRLFMVQAVLLFLLIGLSNPALGKNFGTIILKSGERYENTEYTVDKYFKLIVIKHEGEESEISFSDIQTIYDPSGNDITNKIMGGEYRRESETWLSKESAPIKKYRTKAWSVIVGVEGDFSVPLGDYFEGITSGIGYGANLRFALSESAALRFMVSRAGLKMGKELYEYEQMGIKFSTMRYLGGVDFYKHINWQSKDLSLWYGYAAMGIVKYTMSLGSVKTTESDFALGGGIGIIQMVAPDIGFEGCISYELLFVNTGEESTYYESGNAYIFDIRIGLTKFFAAAN
jgi:hypothetical protein